MAEVACFFEEMVTFAVTRAIHTLGTVILRYCWVLISEVTMNYEFGHILETTDIS